LGPAQAGGVSVGDQKGGLTKSGPVEGALSLRCRRPAGGRAASLLAASLLAVD